MVNLPWHHLLSLPTPKMKHQARHTKKKRNRDKRQKLRQMAKASRRKNQKSVEEVALEEIAGYTAATFPNPKDINHFLKGQPGKVQARICAEYNRKKRELGL